MTQVDVIKAFLIWNFVFLSARVTLFVSLPWFSQWGYHHIGNILIKLLDIFLSITLLYFPNRWLPWKEDLWSIWWLTVSVALWVLPVSAVPWKWTVYQDFLLLYLLLLDKVLRISYLENRIALFWLHYWIILYTTTIPPIGAHRIITVRSSWWQHNAAKSAPIISARWKVTSISILIPRGMQILWGSRSLRVNPIMMSDHRLWKLTLSLLYWL